ncbi:ATP-binding protein [Acinetobacter sp. VNK23]|nr:ATP-binding protein [Acinetobacter thutiue]MDM1019531.1 ATP-binding protein [Acinetobacter thutiue]
MSYQTYLPKTFGQQQVKGYQYRTFTRYFIKYLCLCWLVVLAQTAFAKSSASEQTSCTANIQSIQMAKATGQDGIQRPETDWQNVKLPDQWDKRKFYYTGSTWYKIVWDYQCPTTTKTPITIVISYINMAGQIFINDDLLWQDQSLVEPLSRSWNMPRYWNLPVSSLKQGENILWVRVVGVKSQNSGLGQIFLGNAAQMIPIFQTYWNQQRVLMFLNLITSLTLGVIAFLVWIFHRKDQLFGWFTLATLMWSMVMFNTIMLEAPFGLTTLQIARISIICFFAYSLFSCFYAWRLAQRKFPRLEKILLLMLFIAIGMAMLLPDTALYNFISGTFFLGLLVLLINFISYQWIAYRSKLLEAYLLAFVFLFFIIVSIHDVLFLIKEIGRFMLMPYTAPLTTLLIAIILALRLAKNMRRIEQFNKTLENSVIQAKSELAISLNTQHQLELDNAKLQERLQLAHDLHDGLGGSLVRSMVTVDQSQANLSNQQFLSMLKILRDDLRQVIDSGSSTGAKVPDTPILWGAPLRYRFTQLFDELDITTKWSFPESWQKQPTPLVCLTLLRVAEEALTNILKHSQATSVKCALFFSNGQLVLDIEDNGIGFDVEAVQNAGMSVGLRSMQTRLERLGGHLTVQSEAGRTCLKACLPV